MCAGAALVAAHVRRGPVERQHYPPAPGTSAAQGLFIEMLKTAQLVFDMILMLAAEKLRDTLTAAVPVGLALFVAELTGSLAPWVEFRALNLHRT